MIKRAYIILLSFLVLLSAVSCTREEVADVQETVSVVLDLCTSEMNYVGMTKATAPQDPIVENTIHDFWVVQYSSRGVLLPSVTKKYPSSGTYNQTNVKESITLINDPGSTVCLLANWNSDVPDWPDNLTEYRAMMGLVDIVDGRMPMHGVFQDNVSASTLQNGMTMNVALGRMMTRINIVVNNMTGEEMTRLVVALADDGSRETVVPHYARLFPTIELIDPVDSDGDGILDDHEEDVEIRSRDELSSGWTLPSGESVTLYHYIAPNLYGAKLPTRLFTSVTLASSGDLNGQMDLGNDSPSVPASSRDYRLYPNNNYTFTLNYKIAAAAASSF